MSNGAPPIDKLTEVTTTDECRSLGGKPMTETGEYIEAFYNCRKLDATHCNPSSLDY